MAQPLLTSPRQRYGAALIITLLLILLGILLRALEQPDYPGQIASPLLFAAVVLNARYCGSGPGLLTAVIAAVAFEYLFVPPLYDVELGWKDTIRVLVYGVVLILTSSLVVRWQQALQALFRREEGLRAAREIQQRLFPAVAPSVPGFDIAGASYPAEATGGDYFDFVSLRSGGLAVVIGDVSGHGFGSALLMAETRAYIRALATTHDDPGVILTLTNQILVEDTAEDHFCTVFLVCVDPAAGRFVYAGAGHEAYLLEAGGAVRRLPATSMPLGMIPELDIPCAAPLPLQGDQLLLLLTDGVAEAQSPTGELFGLQRACDIIRVNRTRTAREMVQTLSSSIRSFAMQIPHDDVTVVVLKVEPQG